MKKIVTLLLTLVLTLSYGTPVMYQGTDRIQPFQFQIGTSF